MADKEDGLNLTEELYKLNAKVEGIDQKMDTLVKTDDKAEEALAKSIENEHLINTLKCWVYGLFSVVSTAIVIPLFIYVVEKFF